LAGRKKRAWSGLSWFGRTELHQTGSRMPESALAPLRELRGTTTARKGIVALASADNEEDRSYDDARNRNLGAPTRSALALVGFVAVCFGVALVGSAFRGPSVPERYESLAKPFSTPPS
jgi:hypothetical protein